MNKKGGKNFAKEFWDFLWHSNSIWSWIADLVFLYVLVKLIFFPAMGLIAGTSLPSVIVESESMHHGGNFDVWWQHFSGWYLQNNITEQEVWRWPFLNGIEKGDIIIVSGRSKINLGDVIVFDAGQSLPIIHRVIKIGDSISTKGDNNAGQLAVEKEISKEKIIGKAIFRIPKAGWAKLFFVEVGKKLLQK
jgi:signal peptidase I